MQKQVLAIAFSVLSIALPLKASAQNLDAFYIFGDSLVDNGNLFRVTGGRLPPSPPYFNGRFSNGPVWVELLGPKLGISENSINNFAFAGATTGTFNALSPLAGVSLPGGLALQINGFTSAPGPANPNGLYVLSAGGNDYVVQPTQLRTTDTTAVVNNLVGALTALTAEGATNFLVVNLPDLGQFPQEKELGTSAATNALVNSHNSNLRAALQSLAQNPSLNIIPLDANALFREVVAEPARFGFTNVTDRCFNQAAGTFCPNPDQYLFWDGLHPTAAGQRIIADYAAALITAPQSVVPQGDIALNIARRQTQNINARLLSLRSVRETPSDQRMGVFINGEVNFGDKDSRPTKPGFDFTTTGVTAGVDYRVTDNLALGVAAGYVTNNTDLKNNLGNIDTNGYNVSVYSNFVQENFYTDAVVSYGWNNYDIKRKIAFDNRTATANSDGNQLSVDVNSGYNIKSGNASFGPTVGVRYNHVNIDGYTEKDAGSLNMVVKDQEADSVVLSVGAQASVAISTGTGEVIPYVRATYEHEFANDSREIVTELVTQPGIPMRTSTDSPDRDYVKLGVGTQVVFSENVSGVIGYDAIVGRKDVTDQSVKAEIRFQF